MRLFIHCGLHKTATTSFQRLCKEYQSDLLKFGVYYPNYSNKFQHSFLLHDVQRQDIKVAEKFFTEVYNDATSKCHTILLSGEDFENCIVDLAVAKELEAAAEGAGFVSVTWIVVTRNQKDLIESLYAEMSKHGVVLELEELKIAALERGCFYTATTNYNYIFVLDYLRLKERFNCGTSGSNIEIEYGNFTKDFVGRALFEMILSDSELEAFEKLIKREERIQNKRLSDLQVEANYLRTALHSRRRILRPILLILYHWLKGKKTNLSQRFRKIRYKKSL